MNQTLLLGGKSGLACHFRGEIIGPLSGHGVWRLSIVSGTSNMNHSVRRRLYDVELSAVLVGGTSHLTLPRY